MKNILAPCQWVTVNIKFYRRDFEKLFKYNYYQGEISGKQFAFVTSCSQHFFVCFEYPFSLISCLKKKYENGSYIMITRSRYFRKSDKLIVENKRLYTSSIYFHYLCAGFTFFVYFVLKISIRF